MLEVNGYGTAQRKKNPIISKLIAESKPHRTGLQISAPEDFRRVSAIIDVDIVPETHRRVKLMKNGSDKPLGFYIRDGTSVRLHANGVEKVPGIFISRLVPGGLAESTGLLAVNDEVLEVNGIEVVGKTLDQVTDMMVANSSNLIITVKPVNQRNNISPKRMGSGRQSQKSTNSFQSTQSGHSLDSDEVREYDEHDEVKDYSNSSPPHPVMTGSASGGSISGGAGGNGGAPVATAMEHNLSVRSKDSVNMGAAAAIANSASTSGSGSRGGSIAGDRVGDDMVALDSGGGGGGAEMGGGLGGEAEGRPMVTL